jgi:hypothetical protein
MSEEPIIVVVQGGCVSDVLGVQNYDVFDWDNYSDNPVAYVADSGGWDSEYFESIKDLSPGLYSDIRKEYDRAVAFAEIERRKDPFCDVPAA